MTLTYLTRIFGDELAFKELFIKEFAEKLVQKALTSGEFDSLLRALDAHASEWPTVQEMLNEPLLYSHRYNQIVGWAHLFGGPRGLGDERIFQLTGKYALEKIRNFLQDGAELEIVMADYHSKIEYIRVDVVDKVDGLKEGSPNQIPPIIYAADHLLDLVWLEIGKN